MSLEAQRTWAAVIIFTVCAASLPCASAPLAGQAFHLPPAPLKITDRPIPLLALSLNSDTTGGDTLQIVRIRGEQLVFDYDNDTHRINLSGRTVAEVAAEIRSHTRGFAVAVMHPSAPASWLRDGTDTLSVSKQASLEGRPRPITLTTGFGGVLAPGSGPDADGELIGGAGIHFNVTGTMHLPVARGDGFRSRDHDLRVRLGLALDEAVVLSEGTAAQSAAVSDLLQQANQVSATLAYDRHLLGTGSSDFRLLLSLEFSGAWNRLDATTFVNPTDSVIKIDSQTVAITPSDNVGIREFFGRVEPTSTLGATLNAVGYSNGAFSFYGGLGILHHQFLDRRLSLEADATEDQRCFETVCAFMSGDERWVWRAVLGANLANLFDLRLDAVAGFNRAEAEPLLRILIIKPFTLVGENTR